MPLQQSVHDLYLKECNVRGLRRRLDSATRYHAAQSGKLNQLTTQATELGSQLKQTQTRAQTLEHQARDLETRIEKYRQQMTQVKSNKEYSALLLEVNTLKLEKGKIEEQALTQMGDAERLQGEVDQLKAQVEQQQKVVLRAVQDVEARKQEVGTELDSAVTARDEAAQHVPADVRNILNRLMDQFDGEAMAEVSIEDLRRQEFTCGGCYMNLPVERINALLLRPDELVICPSCGRYLIATDSLRDTLAPKQAR